MSDASCHVELEHRTRRLIEQYPDDGFVWLVLGTALQAQGKNSLPAMEQAAKLLPDHAMAHNTLGNVRAKLGQLDDAVASYCRALAIKPDYAEAHSNLGNVLRDLGHFDDAVASYRWALAIKPDSAVTHYNLGNALFDLGQLDDAVASYRRALAINPDYPEAYSNLGNALKDLGQLDGAVASYRRALTIRPDFAMAYSNLGNALKGLGQLDDAVASYRRALEIQPDFVGALSNLGNAQTDLGQLDDAVASFNRALEIQPDYADAHSNLLFTNNYMSDKPADVLLADARQFGDLVARQAHPYTDWPNLPEPGRCLRVGLVSGDLREHPVGYFLEDVLTALASKSAGSLELIAYPSHFQADEVTGRIKALCHGWHSAVGLSDKHLARQIREDGIDVLIDLSGHTAHNRLPMFAWKPAPVQVSWLGYFATTGVAQIDYLIADPHTLPASEESYFTETIWRLPETRLCFTAPPHDIPVGPLPALTNGHITFGCFNNLAKMNETVVALWSRILTAKPDSRLLLKTKQLAAAGVREATRARFAAHGIDPARLLLEGPSARIDYLAAYHRVDLALDPFPFPGGTTSVEGLWMGVPVLTLAGERFLSRQGVGLLINAGLPEWVATDAEDYVAKAIAHARDVPRLAELRSGLRQTVLASPLFDAARFAGHLEAALRGMWSRWCSSRPLDAQAIAIAEYGER